MVMLTATMVTVATARFTWKRCPGDQQPPGPLANWHGRALACSRWGLQMACTTAYRPGGIQRLTRRLSGLARFAGGSPGGPTVVGRSHHPGGRWHPPEGG